MKLFQTAQIKTIDALTAQYEPIHPYRLMERASRVFFDELLRCAPSDTSFCVVAGSGNNGGDALVIARYLLMIGRPVSVFLVNPKGKLSPDCQSAFNDLNEKFPNHIVEVVSPEQLVVEGDWLIDGLFGSGLNRPLSGIYADIVRIINESGKHIVSIDLPSGLMGEDNGSNDPRTIVKANRTFTFQIPKLSFLLPENERYVGEVTILDIQLHGKAIAEVETAFFLTERVDVQGLLRPRSRFAHKGTCGHALLIAGSRQMTGAAILAARSALRSGCGLLTVQVPSSCRQVLQISVPEAIVRTDDSEECFSTAPDCMKYNAVGVGPGLGTSDASAQAFSQLLDVLGDKPLVVDADALNLLGKNSSLWNKIPKGTILTPHPKEFERISGVKCDGFARWMKQIELSVKYQVVVVLKGAYTSVSFPDGSLHFNTTGNAGMATAGSGDVLTGIILSLLAQGYEPCHAAVLGVWLHGAAGDCALAEQSEESLVAGDLVGSMGKAFRELRIKS